MLKFVHNTNISLYSFRNTIYVIFPCQTLIYEHIKKFREFYPFKRSTIRQNVQIFTCFGRCHMRCTHYHEVCFRSINPSSPKGGCTNPPTVFALVLKIAQPRGKIAPGTFKFILSLHCSEKIPNLPPTPGVG